MSRGKHTKRRVVVTGMGAVTPLGTGMAATWQGIIDRRVPATKVSRFDASEFPCCIAYEVQDFVFNKELVTCREHAFLSRAGQYGVAAAHEALAEAAIVPGSFSPERISVCLGVGMVSPDYEWYRDVFVPRDLAHESLAHHIRFFPDQLGSIVARIMGAKGGVTTVHTACASSGQAVGEAYELVAYGDADIVLTGGADCMISPFYLAGFCLLGALSKRRDDPLTASRPFDKDRDGFVLGEGACMLVLEELDSAVHRGAHIIAEISGYGVTESAYRITDLHPEGTGPVEAMQMALADAGIAPTSVGYLNAHGTSTPLNDRIETLAVNKVFRDTALRLSSTKSMTGHMISAAGAVELAICVKALESQLLPPTVNLFTKDPECPVAVTPPVATPCALDYALSNSVGFGGANTALIAGRFEL